MAGLRRAEPGLRRALAWIRPALPGLRRALTGADYPPVRSPARHASTRTRRLLQYGRSLALLALLGLAAITAQYLLDERDVNAAMAWLIAAVTVAPLPMLKRRPLLAWRVTMLALFIGVFNTTRDEPWPWSPTQLFVALAGLIAVALRADGAVLVWIGILTAIPIWIFIDDSRVVSVTLLVVVVLVVGETVRRVRRVQGALAEQAEVTEREQARRGVLEERARIARELHDVVAHHMSLLAVRAETAPYRLSEVAEPARAEFAALAQAARDALSDLRRLLGVLRSDVATPELAPAPDLGAVDDLVDAARRAGLDVRYRPPEPGTRNRPPEAVALAGFRIIQEALANATRHAPGACVTVQVSPGTRELAVRVHNGPPVAVPEPSRGGQGLIGMRERAALLGGDFTAEPTPEGGFSVTATLPYDGGRHGNEEAAR